MQEILFVKSANFGGIGYFAAGDADEISHVSMI